MKLITGVVGLTIMVAVLKLWTSNTIKDGASTVVMVGAGLGLIVVAWVVVVMLRNRQRRRLMDTRDSALW